jgi:serine/threonine protein kinase
MNPNHLPSGYLLHQRYSIQRSLGQGGFGITYLAYDPVLAQEVCIKELFISGNSTRGTNLTVHSQTNGVFSFPDFVQRFIQEAQQLARFHHPNIVRVLDVFKDNQTAYMVMEFVPGETLKQKIQREGPMNTKDALELIDQLLDAVEEVHKQGMLHRDIKPENILLSPQGLVVLIDFGSARDFTEGMTSTQTARVTSTQTAMISLGYSPPEQYSNRDKRGTYTDIYSIGATLYYLLTGEKPIEANERHLEELRPPHELTPGIDVEISQVVMKAMELRPRNRFQQVKDLRDSLYKVHSSSYQIVKITFSRIFKYLSPKKYLPTVFVTLFLLLLLFLWFKTPNSLKRKIIYKVKKVITYTID